MYGRTEIQPPLAPTKEAQDQHESDDSGVMKSWYFAASNMR